MKKYSVITTALFLIIILFFTSFSVFGKKSDFSEKENRALQTYPELSLEAINDGTFQEEYDAFLSDQFEFRDFWVKARTDILRGVGKKDINGVYLGKESYLLEKYSESDFDSDAVYENIDTLTAFLNKTAENNFVTVAFIPSKAAVLSEALPKNAAPYDTSFVPETLRENISKNVNYIDLYEPLSLHSNEYIYYKTDHHWTSLGAYYAYAEIVNGMGLKADDINAFEKSAVSNAFLGTTYDKIQLETETDTVTKYESPVKVKVNYNGERETATSLFDESCISQKNEYEFFLGGNFARVDIETDAKSDETLVLIKDSFANCMLPFLVNNFKHITLLDLRFFTGDASEVINTEKPSKVLVLYNVEKFMTDQNQIKLEAPTPENADGTGDTAEDEAILAELEKEEMQING